MMSYIVLALVSLLTSVSAQTTSVMYTMTNVSAPALATFTATTVPALVATDDIVQPDMPIGFPFTFYNMTYSALSISTNGYVLFRSAVSQLSSAQFGADYDLMAPIITFMHCDMQASEPSTRSYGVTGTTPDRQFILRHSHIPYYGVAYDANGGQSMDLVLHETTNVIELRYYGFTSSYRYISAGIQGPSRGGNYDYAPVVNYAEVTQSVVDSLVGRSFTFTPAVSFANAPVYNPVDPILDRTNVYTARFQNSIPPLETFTQTGSLASRDDGVTMVPIGFNFTFYNVSYSTVLISDNGNLQFATGAPSSYPYGFAGGNYAMSPYIAFFFADLGNLATTASRTYGIIGSSPNRKFILRLRNVDLKSWVSEETLSVDVLLHEGSNNIEMRYYNIPRFLYSYYYVDIGIENYIEATRTYDYVPVISQQSVTPYIASLFGNKTLIFSPLQPFTNPSIAVGPQPPRPIDTTSTVYQSSQAAAAPAPVSFTPSGTLLGGDSAVTRVALGFNFTFYGWNYDQIMISDNGNAQFQTASTSGYPYPIGSYSNQNLSPFIAYAFGDLYPTTGCRSYATTGSAPTRQFILRLNRCPLQTWVSPDNITMDMILYEGTNNIEFRYYQLPTYLYDYYYMSIGIQNASVPNSWTDADSVSIINYASIDAFKALSLANKTYTISPRAAFVNPPYYAGPTPPVPVNTFSTVYSSTNAYANSPMESFTPIGTLPSVNSNVVRVPIGFNFTFYNVTYDNVFISDNGNLQFQTSAANNYPYQFGSSNLALSPFIAFFYADLDPSVAGAVRQHGIIGSTPTRKWILRLTNVPYISWMGSETLSMDVILHEGTNNIEFKYYRVPAIQQEYYYANIGIQNAAQGAVIDYVAIVNYININAMMSPTFNNKTYMISPVRPFVNAPYFDGSIYPQSGSTAYVASMTKSVVPPVVFTPSTNPSLPNTDNDATRVAFGFDFVFFNVSYSGAWVGANGQLQFQTAVTSQYPYSLGSNGGITPAIFFFYADLVPNSGVDSRTYGTIGTSPNRQFVLRYRNVPLQSYISTERLTMDVILYEGSNDVEFRFYNVPTFLYEYYYATIGIENRVPTGTADWMGVVNYRPVSGLIAGALNSTTYRFSPARPFTNPQLFSGVRPIVQTSTVSTYTGTVSSTVPARVTFTPRTPVLPASGSGVTRVALGFNFTFYNVSYDQVYVAAEGNIQFQTGSVLSNGGTFGSTSSSAMWPFIAQFHTDLWASNTSRSYGVIGSAPNRQFILRMDGVSFENSRDSPAISCDTILTEGTNTIELRYYAVTPVPYTYQYVSVGLAKSQNDYVAVINGVVLDGARALGLSGTSYTFTPAVPFVNPRYYTVPPLNIIDMSAYYNGIQVPNPVTRATFTPITSPSLPAVDDSVSTIQIGFNFVFYNRTYSSIAVSSNGNLQFATSSTTYSPGSFGSGNTALTPFIAFWYADMYPGRTDSRSYGVVGSSPNRQLIIRHTDVWYCCSYFPGEGLNLDIVLFETTNVIELRYYSVPLASGRRVVVGIENARSTAGTTDYVSVTDAPALDGLLIDQLVGSTIRFLPQADVPVDPVIPLDPRRAPQPSVGTSTVYNATVRVAPTRVALTTSTTLPASDDSVNVGIPLGFDFNFYGTTYTAINVGTNGNIQFVTEYAYLSPDAFGNALAELAPWIAFIYSDMNPNGVGAGTRVYATVGTPGSRQFILQTNNIPFYGATGTGWTVDIILYEGSNNIELRYNDTQSSTRYVAVGIEDLPRNGVYDYISIVNNAELTNTLADGMRGMSYLFQPIVPFYRPPPPPFPVTYNSRNYDVVISNATAWAEIPGMTNMPFGDDLVTYVPLPFTFWFYNRSFNSVNISSNGNIQFVTAMTGYSNSLFGTDATAVSYAPVIAHYMSDLRPNAVGQMAWIVQGVSPSRSFLFRVNDVTHFGQTSVAGTGLLMDIILYESSNRIEMRYYRVPLGVTNRIEIGLQNSGNLGEWVYIWNDEAVAGTAFAGLIIGKSVSFEPTGSPPPPPPANTLVPVYGSNKYTVGISFTEGMTIPIRNNMTALPPADDAVDVINIGFDFQFYNQTFTTVGVSTNGNLQFVTRSTGYSSTLFGQTATLYTPIIALFFTDLWPAHTGARSYQLIGTTAGSRKLVVRFDDVWYCCSRVQGGGLQMEVILHETTNIVELNYYRAPTVSSFRNVEIGIQNSGDNNDYVYIWNDVALTEQNRTQFYMKSIKFTPVWQIPPPFTFTPVYGSRKYEVTMSTAPGFPSIPTRTGLTNMAGSDDTVTTGFNIGFPFVFYNQSYSTMSISPNGNLQFMTSSSGYSSALFTTTVPTGYAPIIAMFFTDLWPSHADARQWVVTGTFPNRQFILRFNDVDYCCTRYAGTGLLMEVILTETSNTIEFNYYRVQTSTFRLVEIGLQNSGDGMDWVNIWNDQFFNDTVARNLAGKRVLFTPVNQIPTPPQSSSTGVPVASSSAAVSSSAAPATSSVVPPVSSSAAAASSSARSSSTAAATSSPVAPSSSPVVPSSTAPVVPSSSPAVPSSTARPSSTAALSSTGTVQPSSTAAPQPSSSTAAEASSSSGGAPVDDVTRSSNSLSGGAIAGIVIGVIVGVCILALFCFFALIGYRRDGAKFSSHTDASDEASKIGGDADVHHEEVPVDSDGGEVEMGEIETV